MLRLMVSGPLSRKLRVVDVSGMVYVYALLGVAGLLTCGFALGAHIPRAGSSGAETAHVQADREEARWAVAAASLDALAARLGELQGRMTRLEAIGEQVREASAVDSRELDFTAPPPAPLRAVEVGRALDELALKIDHRLAQFSVLDRLIGERVAGDTLTPRLQPVGLAEVSSGFGNRSDPFLGKRLFHRGMDFAAGEGTVIHAAAAGLVTDAGWRGGYGNLIELDHGGGLTTRYGHNRENLVKAGDFVTGGQAIARVGRTGRVTGPHLHFEVRRAGRAVDPAAYLEAVTRPAGALAAAR